MWIYILYASHYFHIYFITRKRKTARALNYDEWCCTKKLTRAFALKGTTKKTMNLLTRISLDKEGSANISRENNCFSKFISGNVFCGLNNKLTVLIHIHWLFIMFLFLCCVHVNSSFWNLFILNIRYNLSAMTEEAEEATIHFCMYST